MTRLCYYLLVMPPGAEIAATDKEKGKDRTSPVKKYVGEGIGHSNKYGVSRRPGAAGGWAKREANPSEVAAKWTA